MIGFAGLGKYLNERGLSLLKGRKQRDVSVITDKRISEANKTDYEMLMAWQGARRRQSLVKRIARLFFALVMLCGFVGMVLLLLSRI
jgi:hypothetical protein